MILECSVDDCTRAVRSRGLCNPHYLRLRRYGDPCGRPSRVPCQCGKCRACRRRGNEPRDMLACWDCGGVKEAGQRFRCGSCEMAYLAGLWDEDAAKRQQRDKQLRRDYGITIEDYYQMLAEQEGVCGICGGQQNPRYRYFDVDHNKLTGLVRGLLCRRCNTGLGYLEAGFHVGGLAYLERTEVAQ